MSETVDELRSQLAEAQHNLEEFQQDSRELEAELEREIEIAQKRSSELEVKLRRAELESEQLRDRLAKAQQESVASQRTIDQLKQVQSEQAQRIRELEQANDDIQRSERATSALLADVEVKFNQAVERIGMLEAEMEEQDAMRQEAQRHRDEIRDLKLDIDVLKQHRAGDTSAGSNHPQTTASHHSSSVVDSQLALVESLLERVTNIQAQVQSCSTAVAHVVGAGSRSLISDASAAGSSLPEESF
ncbi:hypothetical protein CAOG_05385 [Capsaspora owczarzaki ATCC 30864]|uniref:NUDE domain-containing protein n=1 Tax=Capsaspora owczarzaki (strain ATCC 30864) TaxID=595528 RepID=A0A0D2WT77_CAPO3|nr:hypothetical protein CAOG_05385 [Capsaspora owczarzaki ATCC 30864]KJE94808.1 hypothetical protein CAOG_005385 [Capsaspora owczarzaki ATCC 30864]|eukprot:XP_004347070.1 hypothetical protein CAOG_05385 [Capsaspora owczarzaki ATCC 30864]